MATRARLLFLHITLMSAERSVDRSIAQSIERSVDRSIQRSIEHSKDVPVGVYTGARPLALYIYDLPAWMNDVHPLMIDGVACACGRGLMVPCVICPRGCASIPGYRATIVHRYKLLSTNDVTSP